jgi:hypothetical protein
MLFTVHPGVLELRMRLLTVLGNLLGNSKRFLIGQNWSAKKVHWNLAGPCMHQGRKG